MESTPDLTHIMDFLSNPLFWIMGLFHTVILFGAIICIPVLIFYFRYRTRRELTKAWHEQRLAAIEKGMELPPIPDGFFNGGPAQVRAPRQPCDWNRWSLLAGLVLVAGGAGVGISFYPSSEQLIHGETGTLRFMLTIARIGIVFAAIGVAVLVFWYVAGRKKSLPTP